MTRRSLAAVLLALSLLLAIGACSSDGAVDDGGNSPVVDDSRPDNGGNQPGGPDGNGGPAGEAPVLSDELEAELVAQVRDQMVRWMELSGVPGASIAIAGPGGLLVTEVAGVSEIVEGTDVTPDDFWWFGSVTKTMTTATVYHLADEGLIDIDAPVSDYLGSGWAEGYLFEGEDVGDSLTVKQLLNYTAGFAEYATSLDFYAQALQRLDVNVDPSEVLAWAVETGAVTRPGGDAVVTTVGHIVAGLVIEAASGRPAHEVMREVVFDPTGASDLALPPGEDSATPRVNGYLSAPLVDALENIWPDGSSIGSYEEFRANASRSSAAGELFDSKVLPQELLRTAGWTGGGLEGRPRDVAKAIRAIFGGSVLPQQSVAEMTSPVPGGTFAQGTLVRELDGELSYQQSGIVPGYNSASVYLPEWDIAVAGSANTESPGLPIANLVDELAVITKVVFLRAETDSDN